MLDSERLDRAAERSAEALASIHEHVKVCADRYQMITEGMRLLRDDLTDLRSLISKLGIAIVTASLSATGFVLWEFMKH